MYCAMIRELSRKLPHYIALLNPIPRISYDFRLSRNKTAERILHWVIAAKAKDVKHHGSRQTTPHAEQWETRSKGKSQIRRLARSKSRQILRGDREIESPCRHEECGGDRSKCNRSVPVFNTQ